MSALKIFLVLILTIIAPVVTGSNDSSQQDTLKENQVLYNGRVWRNLYPRIVGDQFLFTPDLIEGNVAIGDHVFHNIPLKYDLPR